MADTERAGRAVIEAHMQNQGRSGSGKGAN